MPRLAKREPNLNWGTEELCTIDTYLMPNSHENDGSRNLRKYAYDLQN